MSRYATCLACGFEGPAVSDRMVDVPAEQQRTVTVQIPVSFRVGALEVDREVPEAYAMEPRCHDRKGCDARVKAIAAKAAPVEPAPDLGGFA